MPAPEQLAMAILFGPGMVKAPARRHGRPVCTRQGRRRKRL